MRRSDMVQVGYAVFLGVILLLTPVSSWTAGMASEKADASQNTGIMPASTGAAPQRRPPLQAIEACSGKEVGEACRFLLPRGAMTGRCAVEQGYFLCLPFPGFTREWEIQHASEKERAAVPEKRGISVDQPIVPKGENANSADPKPAAPGITKAPPPPVEESPASTVQASAPNTPQALTAGGTPDGGLTGTFGISLFATLVAVIIACCLVYWRLSARLRRLRRATRQLAQGNLSVRIGPEFGNRRNEVADLARDIDRMAERMEGLIDSQQRLLRDISHELRSPLTRLNVALDLAREPAGPGASGPLDRIERESNRLNELITQLLTLSKLQSDSVKVEKTEADISLLLEEIAHDVDFEARNCNRRVEILGMEPIMLSVNREMLRQAIENVVRNAIRYTAEGTAVEISCGRKIGNGCCNACIVIRDYGLGVPETEIVNIFKPFYRVADGRERQSGGAGVGLAISDRAIKLHGGSICAINAAGGGFVVEIALPIVADSR